MSNRSMSKGDGVMMANLCGRAVAPAGRNILANQKGMTLIEVMVAVFVLAIGMLGMAALLTTSKQASYEAVQRGIAVALAQDMMGRIRNNPGSLSSYSGKKVGPTATLGQQNCSSTCSATNLAAFDLYSWEQSLVGTDEIATNAGVQTNAGGLVNPTGCITVNGNQVTVAIAWRGSQVLSNPTVNTCGEGAGLYGTADAQRQVLVLQSYVAPMFTFAKP